MNPAILEPEVQAFLRTQADQDTARIALSSSPFERVSSRELATQLDSRKRIRIKVPDWYETEGIYYPERLNIEQSSSAATARYKAEFVSAGDRILDATGGFGVDSYYMAEVAKEVVYCELDASLAGIVRHNFQILERGNIQVLVGDGIRQVEQAEPDHYDLIHLDPARRSGSRKVFLLEDCQPDIRALQDLLLEKASRVLFKLSPMLDIQAALAELRNVREVHIVSTGGECKELLILLDRTTDRNSSTQIPIHASMAADPSGKSWNTQVFTRLEEGTCAVEYGEVSDFLYDPDPALLKAGAFRSTAQHWNLSKLQANTHLYTSPELHEDFMGRILRVLSVTPYAAFKKSRNLRTGMVISRNFPHKVAQLRKQHRIQEGAERYFYFCTDARGTLIVIEAERAFSLVSSSFQAADPSGDD